MQVPVIIDENQGGKCVNDSWEIAKYLEKTYPDQPSLFKGASGKLCTLRTQSDPACASSSPCRLSVSCRYIMDHFASVPGPIFAHDYQMPTN